MENRSNFTAIIRLRLVFLLAIIVIISQGCGTLVHHEVRKGDSLYAIGFYYGQDYRDIAQWNGISSPYVVHVGQWLRVVPPEKDWRDEYRRTPVKTNHNNKKRVAVAKNITPGPTKSRLVRDERVVDAAGPVRSWAWPARGRLLSPNKAFSERNNGIDISGRQGQPVRATAGGEVVYSGSGLIGYGKLLIIKHNKMYLSAYAHNEAMLVKEGDVVKQGQQIAKMGLTPDRKVLLHFEIRKNGKPVDPLRFLARKN